MAPPGLRDVWPDSKDTMRIRDMASKAKDPAHMLRLAAQMAKAITDAGKAFRRGAAAENAGYMDVAKVFYDRCDALTGFQSEDGAERARKEEEARKERAREEEERKERFRKEEARRRRDDAASPAGGGFNEAAIRRKIESVKRLRDGATTPGERAAAENALKVLELKLRTMRLAHTNPRMAAYLIPILRETWEE